MINLETVVLIALVGGPLFGPPGAITYTIYHLADAIGPMLERGDLLPLSPPNPPLPKFAKTKPEVLESIKRELSLLKGR